MEEILGKIFNRIFGNWTGLRLAVENAYGGPSGAQVVEDIIKYMIDFCMKNNVQVEAIQDELDGIMNDEFDTICEDESTKEISIIIHRFLQLLRANNLEQCEIEFNQLPQANTQLIAQSQAAGPSQESNSSSDDDDEDDEKEDPPMEEDEWTVVVNRRKK